MKLELVATPAELQGESVETLRAKITEAALDVARAALVDGLRKAQERADTPAEPHERVRGSERNPEGSARSRTSGAEIEVTKEIRDALREKVREHNEGTTEPWQRVSLGALLSVWRRGAGAFSVSHRPSQNRQSWAYARVNAFLKIAMGRGGNPKYTQDDDLLDGDHPRRRVQKARGPECCGDVLHKARGARGGEVDLVAELAGRMEHLYRMRLSALESDLHNIDTKD